MSTKTSGQSRLNPPLQTIVKTKIGWRTSNGIKEVVDQNGGFLIITQNEERSRWFGKLVWFGYADFAYALKRQKGKCIYVDIHVFANSVSKELIENAVRQLFKADPLFKELEIESFDYETG